MNMPAPGERLPEQRVGPFEAAAVAAYARASGDDNPIHVDATLARTVGVDAPPVHGMRLMAAIEPALAAWRPDLRLSRLSGTFAMPLLVGEAATLSARVLRSDDTGAFLRVTIQGPRRGPCLVAEAQLAPREAGPS